MPDSFVKFVRYKLTFHGTATFTIVRMETIFNVKHVRVSTFRLYSLCSYNIYLRMSNGSLVTFIRPTA